MFDHHFQSLSQLTSEQFQTSALNLFQQQSKHNKVYQSYLTHLGISIDHVSCLKEIPFMPISFFKHHTIQSTDYTPEAIFESSGTTSSETSKHYIGELTQYFSLSQQVFESHFGSLTECIVLGLLPSYLERNQSGLVTMVSHFIQQSCSPYSGFYLDDFNGLKQTILKAKQTNKRIILFGVTFALIDLVEQIDIDLENIDIIETGGMKGRKKEITRFELRDIVSKKGNANRIHSEYGMTELMSQGYAINGEEFKLPPWMRVMVRDINDPFHLKSEGRGGANIIDLANAYSCAFIETSDLVDVSINSFKVLGRLDNSDIRGCNLLYV